MCEKCSNLPIVSICVPVYGVEKYIERCARSLFNQSYDNIEYIFVDDCSKDGSIDILKEVIKDYPERLNHIKIICHEENRGLASARNTGLDAATGKYIIHVDSDDWVEPEMVEECVKLAEVNNADIVLFGVIHEYIDNSVVDLDSVRSFENEDKDTFLKGVITQRISNTVWGKMYQTDLYRRNNVRALDGVNYAEDYAVYPLLVYHAKVIVGINSVFYHYNRSNDVSYTHVYKPIQLNNQMVAYNNLVDFFGSKHLYANELLVALLQIYGWARRKAVLSHVAISEVIKETGHPRFSIKQWRLLSLNHKIINIFDAANLYWLSDAYIVISEKLKSISGNRKKR